MTATIQRYSAFYYGRGQYSTIFYLVKRLIILQTILSLVPAILLLLGAEKIQTLLNWNTDPNMLRLASIGTITITLHMLITSSLRGLLKFKQLALLSFLNAGLILVGTIVTCFFRSLHTLLLSFYCGEIIIILFVLMILKRASAENQSSNISNERIIWQPIIKYSFIIYLTIVVDQIVWSKSEFLFLGKLPSAVESSYYGIAYTIAVVALSTIPAAVTGILMPTFTKQFSLMGVEGIKQEYKKSLSYITWILLPSLSGLIVLSRIIITDLYGKQYVGASIPLQILAVSSAIAIYSRPSGSILHAVNRPHLLLLGGVCALPVDIYLAWKLTPIYGAIGAAIANLIAQIIAGCIVIIYVSLFLRIELKWKKLSIILLASVISSTFAWIVVSVVPIPILRLFLAVLIGALSYLFVLFILKEPVTVELGIKVLYYFRNKHPRHSVDK